MRPVEAEIAGQLRGASTADARRIDRRDVPAAAKPGSPAAPRARAHVAQRDSAKAAASAGRHGRHGGVENRATARTSDARIRSCACFSRSAPRTASVHAGRERAAGAASHPQAHIVVRNQAGRVRRESNRRLDGGGGVSLIAGGDGYERISLAGVNTEAPVSVLASVSVPSLPARLRSSSYGAQLAHSGGPLCAPWARWTRPLPARGGGGRHGSVNAIQDATGERGTRVRHRTGRS